VQQEVAESLRAEIDLLLREEVDFFLPEGESIARVVAAAGAA
jgi:hypothetical protein